MSKQAIILNNKLVTIGDKAISLQNLQPENIKNGVNIGGVVGSYTGSNNAILEQIVVNADTMTLTIDNIQNVTKIMIFQSTMGSKSLSISTYSITDVEISKFSDGWFGYYHTHNYNWVCNSATPTQSQYIKTIEENGDLKLQIQAFVGGRWNAGTYDIVKIYE